MKLDDLIQIAKEGNLTLEKYPRYEVTRTIYLWNSKRIEGTRDIKYMLYMHMANIGGQRYKINKKDYVTLSKILENEKQRVKSE